MGVGERINSAVYMNQGQIERCARDQLERGQLIGGGGAGEERHDILDPGDPEKGGLDFARFREELQGRGGNDPERALAADKELL
jgi:hypothetical protein